MNTDDRAASLAEVVLATAISAFLLSGRWSLSRVAAMDDSAFLAPRTWLVGAIVFAALVPGARLRLRPALPPLGLMAFVGYFLLSAAWAPDESLAMEKAVDLSLLAAAVLGLRHLTCATGIHAITHRLSSVFAVCFGVFAVLGLVSALSDGGTRLAVMGGGPNVYGRNMGVLFVVCLGLLIGKRGVSSLLLGGVALAGLLVLLTGSRGALAGLVAGTITLLFVARIRVSRTIMLAVLIASLITVVALSTDFGQAAFQAFEDRVAVLTFEQHYDSGRSELRDAALSLVTKKPLLGGGLNGFAARGYGVYPHNLELEALAEGGGLGALVLAGALLVPVLATASRMVGLDATTAALFVLHLVCAQTSGDFYDSRGVFVFGMLIVVQISARAPLARARPQVHPLGHPD